MSNASITKKSKKDLRPCRKCETLFDKSRALCPGCGTWDAPIQVSESEDETVLLSEVDDKPILTISNTGPWDPCFSRKGGLVTVGVYLIGGAPGAGKSTMALQLADIIAGLTQRETFYIAAEEAKEQIKDRAARLNIKNHHLIRMYPMGASTDLGSIFLRRKPAAVIIDSLPGMTPEPEQHVQLCKAFKDYAVAIGAPFIVIDQVTKELELAGMMALQHEVDATLLLDVMGKAEGGREPIRQLTMLKSRFGPLRAVYLEMTETGLIQGQDPDDDDDVDEDWKDDD